MSRKQRTGRFAFVLNSAQGQMAEHELAVRYRQAAENLGLECLIAAPRGFRLNDDGSWGEKVRGSEVDFAIYIHCNVPKTLDTFSLNCLLCPYTYPDPNYWPLLSTTLTHDDFLGCASTELDDRVNRSIQSDALHLPPQLLLYPAPAEPTIRPKVMRRSLFYITAGWDRDRHQNLLPQLDRKDLIAIYGSNNWGGMDRYRNYRGGLPFDGRAVVEKISEHGATLALSSDDHIASETMTSRFYEGLAAGALVIADHNPFARRHFGDTLLYVDTREPDAVEQIEAHLKWINDNPDKAAEMAGEAQQIFRRDYSADVCLKRILDALDGRRQQLRFGMDAAATTNPVVRVLWLLTQYSDPAVERLEAFASDQDYRAVQLQVLMPPDDETHRGAEREIARMLKAAGLPFRIQTRPGLARDGAERMGRVLTEGIHAALKDQGGFDEDFACLNVVTSAEQPYRNHLSSLVSMLQRAPDSTVASTAEVFERPGRPRDTSSDDDLQVQDAVDFSADPTDNPIGFARFLIRRTALTDDSGQLDARILALLPYLNRKAMAALILEQPRTQSLLATVLVDREAPFFQQPVYAAGEDTIIRQMFPDFAPVASPIPEQLARHGEQLTQQGGQLTEHGEYLAQQGEQMAQHGGQLATLAAALAALQQKDRRRRRRAHRSVKVIVLLATVVALTWWSVA